MKREYVALFGALSLSERYASLSDAAGRFYPLLLAQCDAWGRITAKPRTLNAMVWPLCGKTPDETSAVVEEIVAAGMLERHEVDGRAWLQVPVEDWESKAGRLTPPAKRGASEWPAPTEYSRVRADAEKAGPRAQSTPAEHAQAESTPDHSGVLRSTLLREEEKREEKSRGEPTPTPPRGRGASPSRTDEPEAGADLEAAFADVERAAADVRHADPPPRRRSKPAPIDPATVPLPAEIDTPDVRAELVAWVARRAEERHPPLGPVGFSRVVMQLAPRGAAYAARAFGIAADKGWRGLRTVWVDAEDVGRTGLHGPGNARGPRPSGMDGILEFERRVNGAPSERTVDVAGGRVA